MMNQFKKNHLHFLNKNELTCCAYNLARYFSFILKELKNVVNIRITTKLIGE